MSDRSVAVAARRGPLHAVSLPKGETFAVTRAPDAARFVLRGDPAGVAAFGPAAPGMLRASESGSRAALRLGPDEILLLAPGEDAEAIRGELAAKLPAGAHSLVDVSHRQIGLVVEGRSAALCLAAGCPLDLRPAAFPIGMATRTIFLKAEIVLWRQADDRFHVEVWRSFAPYLVGHLSDAHAGSSDP
ncbi:sarcosine oxidase subunit gamma [Pinisolibacter sp.]|uniref:sarcosine oxidase subunit gamma n=1 Tax=Pinisolibacter sp. TaxID=2172024 RepID=UPI002FDD9BA1